MAQMAQTGPPFPRATPHFVTPTLRRHSLPLQDSALSTQDCFAPFSRLVAPSPCRPVSSLPHPPSKYSKRTAMTAFPSRGDMQTIIHHTEDNGFLPRCLPEGRHHNRQRRSRCPGLCSRPGVTIQGIAVEAGAIPSVIRSYRYPGCPLIYFRAVPFNFMRQRRLIPNDLLQPAHRPDLAQFVFRVSAIAHWIIATPSRSVQFSNPHRAPAASGRSEEHTSELQ